VHIKKGIEDINKEIKKVQKHKDEVAKYSENASRIMSEQNDIKSKIDNAFNKMRENIKRYNQETSKKSTVLLKCYEQLAKEITRCEHKINENINDPQKIERNVEAMTKYQKYWKAYKEVQRALKEDATPDHSKIIEHSDNYQKVLEEYKVQLNKIESFAEIDLEKYLLMKAESDRLVNENEENKSKLYLITVYRDHKRAIYKAR
jgi:methyl-accepting chemotaxis protein